jgi:hypothetical protein
LPLTPGTKRPRIGPSLSICVSRLGPDLREPFNDAHVALGGVSEGSEGRLVARAVMCGDGLFDAIELNKDRALV